MPNLDGTGPAGKGPKTGGQTGKCAGAEPKGRPVDGRGEGKGRCRGAGGRGPCGAGRGRGNRGNSA